MVRYRLEEDSCYIYAYTDYDKKLVERFKLMKGKWMDGKRAWRFKLSMRLTIENVIADINDELSISAIENLSRDA